MVTPAGRKLDDSRHKAREIGVTSTPPQSKPNSKQREPPPMLFLHPSPGTSHVSLPGILAPGAPVLGSPGGKREALHAERSASFRLVAGRPPGLQRAGRNLRTAESTRSADKTDTLWAEMQATLEEVELSASGGTHVFSPAHDRKLADLRAAQIALAQAWARSEADDAFETAARDNSDYALNDEVRNLKGAWADAARHDGGDGAGTAKNTTGANNGRPESSGVGVADRLGAKIEDETELDILLARKRREANDEYFKRVNNGVIDVVARLEDVAVAMRAVEQESEDVWNENTSLSDAEIE